MKCYYSNDGQQLFDYFLAGLSFALKLSLKMLIYSPFLYSGYFLATLILNKDDNGLLWVVIVSLFASCLHLFFGAMKKRMNILRAKRELSWILFFGLYTAFTCAFPVWIVYGPLEKIISELTHHTNVTLLTWIISLGFGAYVYRQHYLFNPFKRKVYG
jgi:hypothetical protein